MKKSYWFKQEIECLKCKRSKSGCDYCSIKRLYKIEKCNMFKYVLKKFALIGKPIIKESENF
ncbi:MAG: hypothetical protein LUH11_04120 [Candidatus Gastranaerophilales bacterium]|nr:hypothetical protein [Candidatus Gastranaerophilales bacterium]